MIDHEKNISSTETDDVEKNKDSNSHWKPLKKSLSNDEILSQAFLFLIAGSETTATTLTYVAYQLARNPEIQTKLYEEIEKALNDHVNDNHKHVYLANILFFSN